VRVCLLFFIMRVCLCLFSSQRVFSYFFPLYAFIDVYFHSTRFLCLLFLFSSRYPGIMSVLLYSTLHYFYVSRYTNQYYSIPKNIITPPSQWLALSKQPAVRLRPPRGVRLPEKLLVPPPPPLLLLSCAVGLPPMANSVSIDMQDSSYCY